MGFRRTGGDEAWSGRTVSVRIDRFVSDEGEERTREVVSRPGAVAVLAHDGERVFMVRQPREATGEQSLLELPAGMLDREGEDVLAAAKRELAEEIGKAAESWRHLTTFFSSPGFCDEKVHLYVATDLRDVSAEADEGEEIEIEPIPLDALDAAIERCQDSKSLIGLLWLRAYGLR